MVPSHSGSLNLFQFHKGTIRTQFGSESVVNLNLFQFHKGTIRTINPQVNQNLSDISIP